tara:strand:+ start:616 stop:1473 length:858 start_codon:yes stop_codon:yes gene_type:complete
MLYSFILFISIYDLSLSLISLIVLISLDSSNATSQQIVDLPNNKAVIPDEDIANTILYNELDKVKPDNDIVNNDIDIINNDIENTEININADELNFADVINSNEIDNLVINNEKNNEVINVPSPNDQENLYSLAPDIKLKKKKNNVVNVPIPKENNNVIVNVPSPNDKKDVYSPASDIKLENNNVIVNVPSPNDKKDVYSPASDIKLENKKKDIVTKKKKENEKKVHDKHSDHTHIEQKSDCSTTDENLMGHVSDDIDSNDNNEYIINQNSKILAHNEDNYYYNI